MSVRPLVLSLTLFAALAGCSEETPTRGDGPRITSDGKVGKDVTVTESRVSDAIRFEASAGDKVPVGDHITITSPAGGEEWLVGSTQQIRWQTNLRDVTISYSVNGGTTWKPIAQTVDSTSPSWLNYGWKVPDAPSTNAKIQIVGYFGEAPTASATFVIKK